MSTVLAVVALLALAAASAALAHIGLLTETRADGGRYIATAVVAPLYALALLLAYGLALARGGLAPLGLPGHPVLRGLLVLLGVLAAAAVAVVAVGMLPGRNEAASAIGWRRLVWALLLAALWLGALLANFPQLLSGWRAAAMRSLAWVLLMVAVAGAALLLQQGRAALAERAAARARDLPAAAPAAESGNHSGNDSGNDRANDRGAGGVSAEARRAGSPPR